MELASCETFARLQIMYDSGGQCVAELATAMIDIYARTSPIQDASLATGLGSISRHYDS